MSEKVGAPSRSSLRIPVSLATQGGMVRSDHTMVSIFCTTLPRFTWTSPISMISSTPMTLPVVSRSTTA